MLYLWLLWHHCVSDFGNSLTPNLLAPSATSDEAGVHDLDECQPMSYRCTDSEFYIERIVVQVAREISGHVPARTQSLQWTPTNAAQTMPTTGA